MHAKIENGRVVEYPIVNLHQRLPSTSLPANLLDDSMLPEGFVYVHSLQAPYFNRDTHKLLAIQPRLENGKWVAGYEVVPLAGEELEQATARKEMEIRFERNRLLAESDWTQVADSPVNQQNWATYRQALRDITAETGFPWTIDWPAKP